MYSSGVLKSRQGLCYRCFLVELGVIAGRSQQEVGGGGVASYGLSIKAFPCVRFPEKLCFALGIKSQTEQKKTVLVSENMITSNRSTTTNAGV